MIKEYITLPTVFPLQAEVPWKVVENLSETIPRLIETLDDEYVIELFSFPSPPPRVTQPEAAGLRHLAFEVNSIAETVAELDALGVAHEQVRMDENTGKQFLFYWCPLKLFLRLKKSG